MQRGSEKADADRGLAGHRATPLRGSPFARNAPAIGIAIAYGVASIVWLSAGQALPGGRWLVTHLFTLGVLTTLLWSFSRNFAARFTGVGDLREPVAATWALTLLLGASITSMVTGRAVDAHWPLVIGTLGIMVVVAMNVVTLRRLRARARNDRFLWVVRRYENAHLIFLVSAGLGGMLGAGLVPGEIYVGVRDAHIHLNVLGWAGLTVLTTLVVFGPALLRVRIEEGAEQRASNALLRAIIGLGIGALGLVLRSLGRSIGDGAEGPATVLLVVGLAVYLQAVIVVAIPLLRASRAHDRSPLRWSLAAVVLWLPVGVAIDMVLLVVGRPGWSVGLAVALLIGVFAQLILAVLLYVTPMLRGRDFASRDALIARTERLPRTRTAALNLGVVLALVADLTPGLPTTLAQPLMGAGWLLVILAAVAHLAVILWPLGRVDPDRVRSAAAARYRDPSS
jgi:nitrite reductase (NO-forming)